jgi:hypothetical protein
LSPDFLIVAGVGRASESTSVFRRFLRIIVSGVKIVDVQGMMTFSFSVFPIKLAGVAGVRDHTRSSAVSPVPVSALSPSPAGSSMSFMPEHFCLTDTDVAELKHDFLSSGPLLTGAGGHSLECQMLFQTRTQQTAIPQLKTSQHGVICTHVPYSRVPTALLQLAGPVADALQHCCQGCTQSSACVPAGLHNPPS